MMFYAVLCSYTNFRTSYRRIDGISYTVFPGEWVCRLSEVASWFRTRFQHQALTILDRLQEQHFITYSRLGRGHVVKFKITGWTRHNKALDYNAPCQKETGFFFLPVSKAAELVSLGKCSEMDILLGLWINTVYNDGQVQMSDVLVDKDEVAMALNIRVTLREDDAEAPEPTVPEDRLCVLKDLSYVSKTHIQTILSKVVEILMAQGVPCSSCPGITYRLLPLSGECGGVILPPASGHRQFILTGLGK